MACGSKSLFSMISVPVGTGDIPDGMISASQMIYASRMKGTDMVSCGVGRTLYRASDTSFHLLRKQETSQEIWTQNEGLL